MKSAFKIHDTVLLVSNEAKTIVPEMPVITSESKLLSELVLCILSSQEKYEVALGAMKSLRRENILRVPKSESEFKKIESQIKRILKNPVHFKFNEREYSRPIRFFVRKGEYIVNTLRNIYLNDLTIKKILSREDCIYETRKKIIFYGSGLGPKQASMFLRNIGYYSEFAVLDKHVIDYMRIMGLTGVSQNSFSNMSSYQKVETDRKLPLKVHS